MRTTLDLRKINTGNYMDGCIKLCQRTKLNYRTLLRLLYRHGSPTLTTLLLHHEAPTYRPGSSGRSTQGTPRASSANATTSQAKYLRVYVDEPEWI